MRDGKNDIFFPNEEEQDKKARKGSDGDRPIISLSDLSINASMTAMILYEQIYRGYRIMHHHPYHK